VSLDGKKSPAASAPARSTGCGALLAASVAARTARVRALAAQSPPYRLTAGGSKVLSGKGILPAPILVVPLAWSTGRLRQSKRFFAAIAGILEKYDPHPATGQFRRADFDGQQG
jgi:hypothetical protein